MQRRRHTPPDAVYRVRRFPQVHEVEDYPANNLKVWEFRWAYENCACVRFAINIRNVSSIASTTPTTRFLGFIRLGSGPHELPHPLAGSATSPPWSVSGYLGASIGGCWFIARRVPTARPCLSPVSSAASQVAQRRRCQGVTCRLSRLRLCT